MNSTQPLELFCEKQDALDYLRKILNALEEYAVEAGHTITTQVFKTKKEMQNNIKLQYFQEEFLTHLNMYGTALYQTTQPSLYTERFIKKQFYKWIDHSGINANDCPQDLAHFLIATKNVLDGYTDKITEANEQHLETKSKEQSAESNMTPFNYQVESNDTKKEILKTKQLLIGNTQTGKDIFRRIKDIYGTEHNEYDLFSPQERKSKPRFNYLDSFRGTFLYSPYFIHHETRSKQK